MGTPRERTETRSQSELEKEARPEELEKEKAKTLRSWGELSCFLERSEDGSVVRHDPHQSRIGYHELRAIRYAYCILGWTLPRICDTLKREGKAVARAIKKHRYNQLRERIDSTLIHRAVKGMEKDVENVVSLSTSVIKRHLSRLLRAEEELSPKDVKLVSDIGANYHRMLQLIKNRPTSINANLLNMNDEQAQDAFLTVLRKMKEDPMCDMEKLLNELQITPEEWEAAKKKGDFEDLDGVN